MPSPEPPFVVPVCRYAETVLRPTALRTDREGLPADRIGEWRALGLLNQLAPAEFGGAGLDKPTDRRVHEIIAGACLNTWLVWAQHALLVGRLARTGTPGSTLTRQVLRGEVLLGAGVSDVRRFPERYVTARRSGDGWVLTGTLSWVSGWGLSSALAVAAVEPETRTVVTALVPVGERTRAVPLELAAVTGSHTRRVRLDDVPVAGEHVISAQSLDSWRAEDFAIASDAPPQHFGLAETVLRELREHPLGTPVVDAWAPRVARLRADAYGLADEARIAGGGPHRLEERLAVKAASGEALSVLTRALLTARSGHGLGAGDTAQLHARSALFLLVQGQNDNVRRTQLSRLAQAARPVSVGEPS
jgi:alkylation response protein AidB-like acyl-CoA dehydrogenase